MSTGSRSRLGKGSEARGRLSGAGDLEIAGSLVGELDWPGRVSVDEAGRAEVSGAVGELVVAGTLKGRLSVTREAVIRAGARWEGGGEAPSMTTEPGAWLEGEFRIRPDQSGSGSP